MVVRTHPTSIVKFFLRCVNMHDNVREMDIDLGNHESFLLSASVYGFQMLEIVRIHSDCALSVPPHG